MTFNLLVAIFTAAGADLTLKNGQVYKNYRIKSIQAEKTLIAFMAPDGSPDIAEINLADLPSEIANALGISDRTSDVVQTAKIANNTPENVTAQVSVQLKNDLSLLPADDSNGKQQSLNKAAENLKKGLLPYHSDAEFETVWHGTDGVVAKVIKVKYSKFLKVNDQVFIRTTSKLGKRFRAQVYATGCMMQFAEKEMLPVLTFDENSALIFALENILSVINNQPLNNNSGTVAAQPAPPSTQPTSPSQPVINNYYFYDDNDADDIVYVIRDGRRYILPYRHPGNRPAIRPGNRPGNRPAVRPENRPGNAPAVRPENRPTSPQPSRPPIKDKFSKDNSIIQRNDKKIHSYDRLPEWAQPRYSRP